MEILAVDIHKYKDYRSFLENVVGPKDARKGVKSAIAKAVNCNSAYISRVLSGQANLSLEQAELISEYFSMTDFERHYFLILVSYERAGTQKLKKYFKGQINAHLKERLNLKKSLKTKEELEEKDRNKYYSSWHFGAIHMAVSSSSINNIDDICRYFSLSQEVILDAVDFLLKSGLIEKKSGKLVTGTRHIHLGSDSTQISQHHTNWRIEAIKSFARETENDLHFSGAFTVSKEDIPALKHQLMKSLKTFVSKVSNSGTDAVRCLNIDFFGY